MPLVTKRTSSQPPTSAASKGGIAIWPRTYATEKRSSVTERLKRGMTRRVTSTNVQPAKGPCAGAHSRTPGGLTSADRHNNWSNQKALLSPAEVVHEWLAAFNRGDADAMVALYSDDAIHTSPKLRSAQPATEGRMVGKAAMRRWWQDAFDRLPRIRYELVAMVSDDHVAVIEYLRHREGEVTLPVAEVFEIDKGKIVRSHVYHG